MIFIGLGANLPTEEFGSPRQTLEAALDDLGRQGISLEALSGWYRTAPVPASDQPWFVNAVARVKCQLGPEDLLTRLHDVEARFGRIRAERNGPRVIDLDLLAYQGLVSSASGGVQLPHPRLAERAFVVWPLCDIAPDWHHPVTGQTCGEMKAALSTTLLKNQQIEKITGEAID
ncbi:MAG: 2-amino-4-hydroxy-6-hydroxymethyldihydropteridine diphosphokinase [Pseudomonadota bacterium]